MDELSGTRKRLPPALYALALGTFATGTTELPEVAGSLGVTIPTARLLVTGFALGVVFGDPVLTVLTVGRPRKPLLLALMVSSPWATSWRRWRQTTRF